jgi:hypothetical protein
VRVEAGLDLSTLCALRGGGEKIDFGIMWMSLSQPPSYE